jgi:hypothetical protein
VASLTPPSIIVSLGIGLNFGCSMIWSNRPSSGGRPEAGSLLIHTTAMGLFTSGLAPT